MCLCEPSPPFSQSRVPLPHFISHPFVGTIDSAGDRVDRGGSVSVIADVAVTNPMQPCISTHTDHRMIESLRLEKTTKVT